MLHHQADPVGNMAIKLEKKKKKRKIKLWNLESWFFGGRKFGEPKEKKTEANKISTTWNPHIWNDTKEREGNFPNPLTPEI